jgi:hypothetical protein
MPVAITIEERKRRYDAALAEGDKPAANVQRQAARERCRALGQALPEWLVPGNTGRPPKTRPVARVMPTPKPIELPAELVFWRAGPGARAVIMHSSGGVTLRTGSVLTGTAREATFPSVAEAVDAVTPRIVWKKLARLELRHRLY